MGYNLSRGPLVRMERYLQDMAEAKKTIVWVTANPSSLAYRIREALAGAKHHDEFAHYDKLRHIFKIREGERQVKAVYVGAEYSHPVLPEKLTVDLPITSSMGVVGAAIKLGAQTEEIHFTNANLSDTERKTLYNWTQSNDWTYIEHYDNTLTLTKEKVDEDLIWRPE